MRIRSIASPANIAVKEAARLKRKRHRYERRLFLAEGEDLLRAALGRGVMPRQVFVLKGREEAVAGWFLEEGAPGPGRPRRALELIISSPAVIDKLTELGGASRVISVFELQDRRFPGDLGKVDTAAGLPLLYLAGAADPGNVGALIRSAAALGAAGVVLGPGAADPFSFKSLRATMGAVFQVPLFLDVKAGELVSWAQQNSFKIVCAEAHSGEDVWRAGLEGGFALVLGPERRGIPRRLRQAAADTVRIPMDDDAESLNVAMAGSIILYEAARQRSPGRG